jgi:hypothetical protein
MIKSHEKTVFEQDLNKHHLVNDNFTMLFDDGLDLIIDIGRENRTAANVLAWLIRHMDNRNGIIVSQETLAGFFNCTSRSIRNSIDYLKEKKAIQVLKTGVSNIYCINTQIAWKDHAHLKKYADFTAKVYISALEQDEEVQTKLIGHATKTLKKRGRKTNIPNNPKSIENFELEAKLKHMGISAKKVTEWIKNGKTELFLKHYSEFENLKTQDQRRIAILKKIGYWN